MFDLCQRCGGVGRLSWTTVALRWTSWMGCIRGWGYLDRRVAWVCTGGNGGCGLLDTVAGPSLSRQTWLGCAGCGTSLWTVQLGATRKGDVRNAGRFVRGGIVFSLMVIVSPVKE